MKIPLYNQKAEEIGQFELPQKIFGAAWNPDLVHQAVETMRVISAVPVAHAKGRGEVRGGGKKPWKQKGTGRARHGSRRSPIWVGGGVTHGPNKEKSFDRKINKKAKIRALFSVLSRKLKDGEIIALDSLVFDHPKTKEAQFVLDALAQKGGFKRINYKKGKRALIAVPDRDEQIVKSFRNIPSASVSEVRNLNPLETLSFKYLILVSPDVSLGQLEKRMK